MPRKIFPPGCGANVLGFSSYAAYVLDDQMAKTPDHALKLLTDLIAAATAKASREASRMQQVIDSEKGGFTLGAADWELYAEKVRKADYDIDEAQGKAYSRTASFSPPTSYTD